jgi:SAM-dependent methyltransferase
VRINDPKVVEEQYANEANLRARQALWEHKTGTDPKAVLWQTLQEWQPRQVLEVGGGQAELAERMQRELGANVTFVDISPRMVELARARGIEARVGDAQELPFADASFDTVVAAWMLYHVPDVEQALAEFARVLRPGGALVAVTNGDGHLRELRELLGFTWEGHTFSRENGEELLRRHFRTVERLDTDVEVTVFERDVLVAYGDSVWDDTRPVPEDLPLPFVVHGNTSIFFATT